MFVLENHYNGNHTILIHNRIINGCQDFTLDEADSILKKYRVSSDVWQQVLDVYTGVSTDEQIESHIQHHKRIVRMVIAHYGSDRHRDMLIDDNDDVRRIIVRYGNDAHRDMLINDMLYIVRATVAKYGNDTHRDKLIGDSHWCVRRNVAQYGNDAHRDVLINDRDEEVRHMVAKYYNL